MKKRITRLFSLLLTVLISIFSVFNIFFDVRVEAANMATFQQDFINALAPTAMSLGKQYHLFPSVMIAQAILESDWGRSQLASAPYYNLFGIKSADSDTDGAVFDTQEDDGFGNLYWIKDSFRRYNSMAESMYDYAKLFTSTPFLERHYANFLNASTVQEATRALTGTYATDIRYGTSLMNIIVAYDLLKYDTGIGRGPAWALNPTNDYVYVTHDEVNIRPDHSTDNEPMGRVHTNMRFLRKGYVTGWSLIVLDDGREAYIASQYLSSTPVDENGIGQSLGDKDPDKNTGLDLNKFIENEASKDDNVVSKNEADKKPDIAVEPDASGYTQDQKDAAKKAADEAIAKQTANPTVAPQKGVLDVRTVIEKPKNAVNKTALENLLGSDVNKPFVSDELKKEYRQILQQARAVYYNADASQEKVDSLVTKLKRLQAQAGEEHELGQKVDEETLRTVKEEKSGVYLEYSKKNLAENVRLEIEKTRKPSMDLASLHVLNKLGERYVQYSVKAKDQMGNDLSAKQKLRLHLPIPEGLDIERLSVYRFDEEFVLREVNFELDKKNKEVIIEQQEFTKYIILEKNDYKDDQSKDKDFLVEAYNRDAMLQNSASFTQSLLFQLFIFAAVLSLAIFVLLQLKRRWYDASRS